MTSSRKIEPGYLDLQAVAVYTSLSVRTWREILKRPGGPPYIKVGGPTGKILLQRAAVDAWLAQYRREPLSEPVDYDDMIDRYRKNPDKEDPGKLADAILAGFA